MNAMIMFVKSGPVSNPHARPVFYHVSSLTGQAPVHRQGGTTHTVTEFNQKGAGQNPKAVSQLDRYKHGFVSSLTGNLQRFGFEKVAEVETLLEIIDQMGEDARPADNSQPG